MTSQADPATRTDAGRADFNRRLLAFLAASPTPFHAVANLAAALDAAGFIRLDELAPWALAPGERYYCTRNGSSIIAFVVGSAPLDVGGIRLVGAHTDSPCLMVKPQPEITTRGYFKLGVEVYGGALLAPWFDRDLSLAGRVVYRDGAQLRQMLVDFGDPVAVIPSLAIHLDRGANDGRAINAQTDIPPVLFQVGEGRASDFRQLLAERFLAGKSDARVLDYELYFYDTQKPALVGLYGDFIASARLDNLLSCFVGLDSILAATGDETAMLVCADHEEVGSVSACGAQGPMLASVLERLVPDDETRTRVIARSLMISADNAHGVHPNFVAKHDENHGPLLNQGPVIKVNARQRYATSSLTAALFRQLAHEVDAPLQSFVTRTDMGCGSTIGPVTAAEVGVPTLDVGVPTFAMHSIRELAGTADAWMLRCILAHFHNRAGSLVIAEG
ncbi:MAG TPA: M18 family aminopeptidase [Porticoccaceae bacterium]|nr:M18 family aminopeptidase [Pseudomonadota bacterium]HLS98914.1 M18 family aminopeptidase [Porticoccaceae bacterium]